MPGTHFPVRDRVRHHPLRRSDLSSSIRTRTGIAREGNAQPAVSDERLVAVRRESVVRLWAIT
jgi:hypothetical protein